MLEKPDITDQAILACVRTAYGLPVAQINFLPLGADQNTAVYRIVADDKTPYFLKLRGGIFDETSVTLPKLLADQDITQLIAPLPTQTEELWANLERFKVILYPFIVGRNGYERSLSERHWRDLGAALKRIHAATIPAALISRIRQETYASDGRETVKSWLDRVERDVFDDPAASKCAAFLRSKRGEILDLVGRAERLAEMLQTQPPDFVVCHSDLHAGNVLIDDANDDLYIVDWDDPILAPKERDLMYAGGGLMGNGRSPQEEEMLFYEGYGPTPINPTALAYYRYERIVQDIAAFSDQLLLTNEGCEDRERSLGYLMSNFLPGRTIEIAYQSDKAGLS